MVVNSARVSFSKESKWERDIEWQWEDNALLGPIQYETPVNRLSKADSKLINYLASHGHWTPFAHPQITVREKVPIFVARQRFKHMVGFTYNEVSRRYVSDSPEFFVPDEFRNAPEVSVKQGSGGTHPSSDLFKRELYEIHKKCEQLYTQWLEDGVAPEQARMVLPQSMYTEYYVTGSLAAWARAYTQRIDAHAQREIQDLAKQWEEILEPLFPVSWGALTEGTEKND